MPRNSSGVYSKPAGTTPTNGDDADATQFNLLMDDMTQALTDSLPRDGSAPMTGALAMGSNKITGLATGTDAGDAVRFDQISGLAPKLVPAGTIIFTAQSTAPSGYLKANAPTVSRTTYAALFAAIGTYYGAGDGSTTFVAGPDMRGEFTRGWDDGRGVDSGRVLGASQTDIMRDHYHSGVTSYDGSHNHIPSNGGNFVGTVGTVGPVAGSVGGTYYASSVGSALTFAGGHTHTFSTYGPSAPNGAENRPRNIALLACIKY